MKNIKSIDFQSKILYNIINSHIETHFYSCVLLGPKFDLLQNGTLETCNLTNDNQSSYSNNCQSGPSELQSQKRNPKDKENPYQKKKEKFETKHRILSAKNPRLSVLAICLQLVFPEFGIVQEIYFSKVSSRLWIFASRLYKVAFAGVAIQRNQISL